MDKSDFMPKVAINGEYGYSDNDNNTLNTNEDGDYYSFGASVSIPFDFFKDTKLDVSKKEYMIEKYEKFNLQKQIEAQFDQIMDQVDTYKEQNDILKGNIKLYEDLIGIADAKVKGGYSPAFDLDILYNSKEKDTLEIQLNDINIKQQYALLYFKMMR